MKIAFTGASGYIGKTFKRVYQKLDLVSLSYDLQKGEYFSLNDVTTPSIEQFLDPIEVLIHLGSFMPKNIQEAQDKVSSKKNMESTIKLLTYRLPSLKHIIYISTIDVYDFTFKVSEKTKPNPKTEYAISKFACENIVKQFAEERGILFSILRVGTVYGPGEDSFQKVIPTMLKEFILKNQITIYDNGSVRRNFLYVDDVAKMIGEVVFASRKNKLINLIGLHSTSIRELADIIQLLKPEHKASIKEINSIAPSSDHDFDTTFLNSNFPNFKFMSITDGLNNELNFIQNSLS